MRAGVVATFLPLGSELSFDASGNSQVDKYGRAISGSASVFVSGTAAEAQSGSGESWLLEASDPWIHVPVTSGKSSMSFRPTVDPNTSGAPREGFVRLTGQGGLFVYPQASTLAVNQS